MAATTMVTQSGWRLYQEKLAARQPDPPMTAQQVFDKVATHLLTQNAKSVGSGGYGCFYRNSCGLKCAAGCLIPDDIYDQGIEGTYWDGLTFLQTTLGVREHVHLIRDLQRIHDIYAPIQWSDELTKLALHHKLNPGVCDVSRPTAILALQES